MTHTLSIGRGGRRRLCDLVTAPFEPFDALVCTSRAAVAMVRAVTGVVLPTTCADRFGGRPDLRPRLEVIPLGVNADRFRPGDARTSGPPSGPGSGRPTTRWWSCASAGCRTTPRPTRSRRSTRPTRPPGGPAGRCYLVFAGWAAHPAVETGVPRRRPRNSPRPPASRSSTGQDPAVRFGAWHAADVFLSLPDNIQETFGLVVVEAMASGLPVVGSDWDGYRDLVVDGETGFLVPTRMVRGATARAHHPAGCSGRSTTTTSWPSACQAVAVDPAAAADALARLVADDGPAAADGGGRPRPGGRAIPLGAGRPGV